MKHSVKSLCFLMSLTINLFAFSGTITTDTTWAENVILTGNVTVNAGTTLTIADGVKVQAVWVDNNADLIGDILFTVNGKLAPAGTATFESYDKKNSRQSWMGLVLSGPKQTVNGLKIKNAWRGLSITETSDTNTISNVTVDSCLTGVYLDNPNDTNAITTLAVRYCSYGIVAVGAKGIYANDVDVNHNDSGGISLTRTTAKLTNVVAYTNGMYGVKTGGSGTLTLSNATLTGNIGYGLFVDTTAIASATLCDFFNNTKPGILVTSNTANALNLSASNIYGNAGSVIAKEDTVDVSRLNYNSGAQYKLPLFTNKVSIGFTPIAYCNFARADIGTWSATNCGVYTLAQPLPMDSISLWSYTGYGTTHILFFSFDHSYQLLYLTNTHNIIPATNNWWGQITGIDTLIGTQTLVTWSGYRTEVVPNAGSTNSTQRITVSKLSQAFSNTAVTFSDSAKLTIKNTGGSILRLDSVGCTDTSFKIRHQKSSISNTDVDTVTITFKPATAKAYSAYLNIACNDPTNQIVQILLTGTGVAYNFKPRFVVKPADTQCVAGDAFARIVRAQDSNATDTLIYSLLKNPTGMTIASLTGVISWTPTLAATTDSVVIKVADPLGLFDTCRFKLTVAHRPIFTTVAPNDTLLDVGAIWDFDINATDTDGHSMTWSFDKLVGNMMISQASGLIHFVPAIADTGRHQIIVRATDSLGASAVQSFYIRVKNGPISNTIGNSITLPKTFGIRPVLTFAGMTLRMAVPENPFTNGQYVNVKLIDMKGRVVLDMSDSYLPGWYTLNVERIISKQLLLLNVKTKGYSNVFRIVTQ